MRSNSTPQNNDARSPAGEPSEDGRVVCAGCRQEMRRTDAERVVWHDRTGIVYDMRGGAPGEEAFVHPHPECARAACWGGFGRMLGREIDRPDRDEFVRDIREGLKTRLLEQLREAGRRQAAGATIDRVSELLDDGVVDLVLVAEDASTEAEQLARGAERADIPVIQLLEAADLGEPAGRDRIEVWALTDEAFGEACGLNAEKIVSMQSTPDRG